MVAKTRRNVYFDKVGLKIKETNFVKEWEGGGGILVNESALNLP